MPVNAGSVSDDEEEFASGIGAVGALAEHPANVQAIGTSTITDVRSDIGSAKCKEHTVGKPLKDGDF